MILLLYHLFLNKTNNKHILKKRQIWCDKDKYDAALILTWDIIFVEQKLSNIIMI